MPWKRFETMTSGRSQKRKETAVEWGREVDQEHTAPTKHGIQKKSDYRDNKRTADLGKR